MPEPQSETSVVQREVRIEARPETVFPYFTDPEKMVRWIGVAATLDPRPGGVFHLQTMANHSFAGHYVTIEPPRRVVFTWGYGSFPEPDNPLPAGSSTVEVELEPDGDATIVRLTHRVPSQLDAFHAMGWEHYLDRLALVAVGRDAGKDELRDLMEAMILGDQ